MEARCAPQDLGVYYRRRFDFLKRHFPSFDPLTIESFLNLLRTTDLLRAKIDARMRPHDLTGPSIGILSILENAPGKRLTMCRLSEQMVVTQANVTGLVDTLEHRGLVVRRQDPNDRRVRYIEITLAGSRKLRRVLPGHIRFIHDLFHGLKRREKESLIRFLEQIRAEILKPLLLALGLALFSTAAPAAPKNPDVFQRQIPFEAPAAPSSGLASGTTGYTLEDCYRMALAQSENLQIRLESIFQLQERIRQGFGGVLPSVDFLYTEFIQDTDGMDTSGSGSNSTFTRRERPEGRFTLRQPIFAGLREHAAISAARASKKEQDLNLARAQKVLFEAVAMAFYDGVRLETDRENVRAVRTLTQERIRELEGRVRLGKSRTSELLSVESQLAGLHSQEESLEGQVEVAREVLSFLIGRDLGVTRLEDQLTMAQVPSQVDPLLQKAAGRTDLAALSQEIEVQKQLLKVSKGLFYPSLNLLGNYYVKRVGFYEPIDWDVLFTLDVPLFRGGSVRSEVREGLSRIRQAQTQLRLLSREVESEVRRSYHTLQASLAQHRSLEEALRKAEESYRLQVDEYRHGLVNNLEVLQAMNTMLETKRNLDRSILDGKLAWVHLNVTVESWPEGLKERP